DLMSRTDNETIGSVSDLLFDENGRILAVIVEVGGFLGVGKKEVAVSWDSVEHSLNEDGDGYDFSVTSTKDTLRAAPEYEHEAGKARPAGSSRY
ncbi:PRC-barrel domain-containing protein, partial [Ectothiorhodospira lacustris]